MSQKPAIATKDNFSYSNDLVSNCNSFLLGSHTARYNGTDVVSAVNSDPKLLKLNKEMFKKSHTQYIYCS